MSVFPYLSSGVTVTKGLSLFLLLLALCPPSHSLPFDISELIDPVHQSEQDGESEPKRVVVKSVFNVPVRTDSPVERCPEGTQRVTEDGPCVSRVPNISLGDKFLFESLRNFYKVKPSPPPRRRRPSPRPTTTTQGYDEVNAEDEDSTADLSPTNNPDSGSDPIGPETFTSSTAAPSSSSLAPPALAPTHPPITIPTTSPAPASPRPVVIGVSPTPDPATSVPLTTPVPVISVTPTSPGPPPAHVISGITSSTAPPAPAISSITTTSPAPPQHVISVTSASPASLRPTVTGSSVDLEVMTYVPDTEAYLTETSASVPPTVFTTIVPDTEQPTPAEEVGSTVSPSAGATEIKAPVAPTSDLTFPSPSLSLDLREPEVRGKPSEPEAVGNPRPDRTGAWTKSEPPNVTRPMHVLVNIQQSPVTDSRILFPDSPNIMYPSLPQMPQAAVGPQQYYHPQHDPQHYNYFRPYNHG